MKGNPEERAIALGQFVVETGATVRSAAQKFGVSKSTVHKDFQNIAGIFHGKNSCFLVGGAVA